MNWLMRFGLSVSWSLKNVPKKEICFLQIYRDSLTSSFQVGVWSRYTLLKVYVIASFHFKE